MVRGTLLASLIIVTLSFHKVATDLSAMWSLGTAFKGSIGDSGPSAASPYMLLGYGTRLRIAVTGIKA